MIVKPKYKIGDKVLVKSKYDPGCISSDYRFTFTLDMLKIYGSKVLTIESNLILNNSTRHKIPDDGYLYKLKESCCSFSSGMFEEEF